MKLGEDIDLDELLLDSVLFVFVLSSLNFFRGVLFGSLRVQKTPSIITINVESRRKIPELLGSLCRLLF